MPPAVETAITAFPTGQDNSPAAVNAVEVAPDDAFPDGDHVRDTVEKPARYRPGAAPRPSDAVAVRERLARTLDHLRG